MKQLVNFLDHLQCPSINGIIYPDGKIQHISLKVDWKPSIRYTIGSVSESSVRELQRKGDLEWNSCAVLDVFEDEEHSIEIYTGESDWGSEGFFAVIDGVSKKLLWMAFFKDSNPFKEARIRNGYIYATSTLNCIWKFNITPPELICVECSDIV